MIKRSSKKKKVKKIISRAKPDRIDQKLKKEIDKATKKVVRDYGDVIRKLGEE